MVTAPWWEEARTYRRGLRAIRLDGIRHFRFRRLANLPVADADQMHEAELRKGSASGKPGSDIRYRSSCEV